MDSFKHVEYWSCCVKLATHWHWQFNLTLKLVIQGKRYFKAGFINKGAEFHRKIIYLCINCTDIVDDLLYFILWKQESTSNDTNWTNVCFLSLIIKWFSVYFRFSYCHISFTNWNYLTLDGLLQKYDWCYSGSVCQHLSSVFFLIVINVPICVLF